MFYCDPCAQARRWPGSIGKSMGRCELCKTVTECNDRPSSTLPNRRPRNVPAVTQPPPHHENPDYEAFFKD